MPTINVTFTPDDGFGSPGTKLKFKLQAAQIANIDGRLIVSGPPKDVTATVGTQKTIAVYAGQPYILSDLKQGGDIIRCIVTMPETAGDITDNIVAAAAIPITTPISTITTAVETWLEANVDTSPGSGGGGLTLVEDPNRPGIYLEA